MQERTWVVAAPFRAHLNHVCAATGLPWPIVALDAGVPLHLAHALLDERNGRRVQRIAPELAEQVLAVSARKVEQVRSRAVPARSARQSLRRLTAAGWTYAALAHRVHTSLGQLEALAAGLAVEVPALLDLRLTGLLAMSTRSAAQTPARPTFIAA